MSYIRVVYKTNEFDYVSSAMLDSMISTEEISRFYRTSEKRWIDVMIGPIRGKGGVYQGPERRSAPKSQGKRYTNPKRPRTNWFECLWRYHGQKEW